MGMGNDVSFRRGCRRATADVDRWRPAGARPNRMRVGIPSETTPGERRVALVPSVVTKDHRPRRGRRHASRRRRCLTARRRRLHGRRRHAVDDAATLFDSSGFICKVQPPTLEEVALLSEGSGVVSYPPARRLTSSSSGRSLRRRITAFSLDLLPRISRSQSMDVLSSQALVSGYRAVLLAAEQLPKFFPLYMTAAGTVPPAKVLVLGAGVAGLQAIATARRLGAVVRAYDVRPAARDEVKSLGAAFVELELETQEGEGGYAREQSEDFLRRQRELIGKEVAAADVVITTAAIPGRKAPVLVTGEMVHEMTLGQRHRRPCGRDGRQLRAQPSPARTSRSAASPSSGSRTSRARCRCTPASSTRATSPSSWRSS